MRHGRDRRRHRRNFDSLRTCQQRAKGHRGRSRRDRGRHHRPDHGASGTALRRSDIGHDQAARRRNLPRFLRKPGRRGRPNRGNPEDGRNRIAIFGGSTATCFRRSTRTQKSSMMNWTRFARSARRLTGLSASPLGPLRRPACVALSTAGDLSSAEISSGARGAIEAKGGVFFADTVVQQVEERMAARSSSRPIAATSPPGPPWSRPIRRSSIRSRCIPRWRRIAPMRWHSRSSAAPCPMRCTGTRSIPIIMCGFSRAMAEPTTSSSAAPITRAAKLTMPICALRRWRPGREI